MPKRLGTFTSLESVVHTGVTYRSAAYMNLSGYPVSSHVVNRILNLIDLTSYKTMLESILKLRNLTRLASEVLNNIIISKVDKAQLVRNDMIAYIDANKGAYGRSDMTLEDMEIIAHLIVAAEATDTSWSLTFSASIDNRFVAFQRLYLALTEETDYLVDVKALSITPANPSENKGVYVFDPEDEKIIGLGATRRAQALLASGKTRKASREEATLEFQKLVTVHKIPAMRIIDHVAALMNSTELWKTFITPRNAATTAQNEERAKGLKLLSSYFHSLLMYPHLFTIELFKGTYHKLEDWIVAFPAIPAELIAEYNHTVSAIDVLGAHSDAASVLAILEVANDPSHDSRIVGYPTELTELFEIEAVVLKAVTAAMDVSTPITIPEIKSLGDPGNNALLLSHPIDTVDITYSLTQAILVRNVVTSQLKLALAGVIPGIPRFYSDEVSSRLRALALTVPFGISSHIAYSAPANMVTDALYTSGNFKWNPLAPARTYDYQMELRRTRLYSIFTSSSIVSDWKPQCLINEDVADRLRGVMERNWRALMPSNLWYGDFIYTIDMLKSDPELVRRLLEGISGDHYELITRSITNPYIREIWATFLSSAFLIYAVPSEDEMNAITAAAGSSSDPAAVYSSGFTPYLVVGAGNPYGTSYPALAAIQSENGSFELIKITPTVFLRPITHIPLPSNELTPAAEFYLQRPYYYYPANGATLKVTSWVMAPSLLNFALAPIMGSYSKAAVLLDKRYAYLNDTIFMQYNLAYSLSASSDGETAFSLPIVKKPWNRDRFLYHIDHHVVGGDYGAISVVTENVPTAIATIMANIENSDDATNRDTTIARHQDADAALTPPIKLTSLDDTGKNSNKNKPKKKHNTGDKTANKRGSDSNETDVPGAGGDEDEKVEA